MEFVNGKRIRNKTMRGKPKFKLGDIVSFNLGNETKKGEIWVVDAYGTFQDPSDVSYDVMVAEENCLYKHLTESLVIKKHRKTNK